MAENPTLQIPKDVIEPIIAAHIAAAVASALSGRDVIVQKAVESVLSMKVDSSGQLDKYGYSHSITYVQWLMQDAIKKAAKDALVDEMAKHQDFVRKHIAEQLRKSNSPLTKQFVEGMMNAMVSPDALKYRLTVAVAKD